MTRRGRLGSPRSSRGSGCSQRAFLSWPSSPRRGDFKGGSVSHGPAALATLRPCELLPMGALSRGNQGNWRWKLNKAVG